MYYHTCPMCGANLDPGESCDCIENTPSLTEAATGSGKPNAVPNGSTRQHRATDAHIRHSRSHISKTRRENYDSKAK